MNAIAGAELRDHFLTWQCRIRQIAMREDGGRPSQGMRPTVLAGDGTELSPGVILLIVREDPEESTEFLKFQVKKQNDPQEVYNKALTFLQSTHYHRAVEFTDEMTGLFAPNSSVAARLLNDGRCVLRFAQFAQGYTLPCQVRRLGREEPAYQATLWHNRVFNSALGDDVAILGFQPDWSEAKVLAPG